MRFAIINRFLHVLVTFVEGRVLLINDYAFMTVIVLVAIYTKLIIHHIIIIILILVIEVVLIFSVSSTAVAFSFFALLFFFAISNIRRLGQLIINLLQQFVLIFIDQV